MLVRPAIIWGYILVANQKAELFKRLSQIFLCNSDRSRASFLSFYPLVFLFRCCCLHLCFILCSFHRQLSYVWLMCLSSFSRWFHFLLLIISIYLNVFLKLICIMLWKPVPCLAELPCFQLFSQLCNYSIFNHLIYICIYIHISWHIAMYKKLL